MEHDKSKYADCRFRRSAHMCSAMKDTYCDYEDCNFYKPKTAEAETEAIPKNRYNRLSADKVAEIRELYKGGMTQRGIASAVGTSQGTVSKYLRGFKEA